MNKKIFILLFFMSVLISVSAVSAVDLDDNNGTVASSNDAGALAIANDVNAVDDLNENDSDGDIKFVAVGKDNENNLLSVNNDENENILKGDTAGFDELMDEIKHGTSPVVLSHKNYKIDKGDSILLNRPITIDGNGATIDMNGKDFAIFIGANEHGVGIRNLIIKNMDADNEKGVIKFSDTPGSIINCTFVNNRASSGVGAIQVSGPDHVRIINCTFVNNFGSESGAICFKEGCYDSKVENCAFVGNSADSGKSAIGGKDTGSIPLNDNWWGSNNPDWAKLIYSAEPSSYAVLNVTTDTTIITVGSKAKLNYAFYRKGTADRLSLPARQIKLSTTGGKLDKTSGDLINEFSTEFSSNTPGYYEITATVDNEKIKIPIYVVNKIIYVNSSVDSSGDGKTNETPFKTLKESLDVAEDYDTIMIAVGTYTGSNNVDLTIEKNNLIFNKYGDGEAIFDAQGDCRIWTVNTSSSTIININGLIFKNGNAKSGNYGGAIYFKNNVVDSNINADFINNTAMYGGAIYYSGKVTDSSLSGIYTKNTETSVIYLDGESENSVIHDAVFINNYNNIYVKSGTITVTNCWFGNNATNYNEKPDIGIDLNDWLFLNATAEPGEIKLGQSSTITFKLYNKNSPAVEYDASKMNIVLDLNQTLGELDKTTVSLGEKTSYTSKESGNASVTGKFETASYTINLKNKPKIPVDIILENETIDLEVGDEVSAGATLNPPVGNLTYTSSNESVVIVENGVIKAVGEGTANVTVSFNGTDEYAAAERNITVCVLSEAEWYYMADGRINNLDGASGLILPFGVYTCVVLDSNGQPLSKGLNVNIKLNDDYILNATVGEDGMFDLDVSGIKTGKYTATFSSYGYTHAVASFFIVKKQTDIALENSTMALKVNDIVSSGATLNPADAGDLTYTSSNSSVAIVENGNIKAIAIGTAVITVSFSGNANYYATKNKTIEVTVSKIPTEITVQNSTLDMKVGDGTVIVATLTPVGAGNVTFTSSNESVVEVDDEGNVLAQGKGQAIITVSFAGNNNCTAAENKTVTVTVSLNDASVTVDNNTLDLKIGEKYAINATKHPDTIVLDITYTSSNKSVATVDRKGIVTAVGEGTAVITVEVGEDVIYAKNSTNVTVTVSKIPTEITLTNATLDLKVDDEVKINATLTPSEAGELDFTSSDVSVVTVNSIGEVTAVGEGVANVTVRFMGNNKYAAAENKTIEVTVSLNDANVGVNNSTLDLTVGDTFTIVATTTPDNLNVTYIPDNSGVVSVDEKGKVTALKEGNATIVVKVGGDGVYAENSTTVTVTVSLKDASVVVDPDSLDLKVGETGKFYASTNPEDLDITVSSSNESVATVKLINRVPTVTAVGEGSAVITVTINEKNYVRNSTTVTVTVTKIPTKIRIQNDTLDMVIGDVVDPVVSLMPSDAGNMSFIVSDVNVVLVNGHGVVKAVGVGNATVTVRFGGNDKYLPSNATITVSVKNALIIKAPDVVKYYAGPERFVVNVTDSKGTPLSNKSVIIVINKVTYTRTTDKNGTASIGLNLHSGTYNATVTVDNKTVNSVVTVLTTVNGTDVLKMYKNGTQYYATFIDSEGKYLADGTTVKFNINGVFYERKVSGDKGQAKLNINLPAGKYVITAMNPITGENATNNVTVLSYIVENYDLTKYYKNASQYSLRLLDDKGNPVGAGVSVQFNINGVFYTRTSDANGYVKMNINLPPGTYIITAEYKGLKASNTIKVLSVLETEDLVMKYKDGSKFEAKILDGQGKPYAGQTVKFNINGVFYTKTTGNDGIAALTINLLAGEYIITSSYNGLNAANKVTISG